MHIAVRKTLSATGEEIGESTVALQVKVTELTNKTNDFWDKWISCGRQLGVVINKRLLILATA